MQIKLAEIVNNTENLKELQSIKFPVKISYRISKLINKLQSPLKIYDEERNDLVKEYGEVDEKTGEVKVTDPEKLKLFFEELKKLLEIEEEVEFEKIKVEDIGDVKIESKLLIDWLFE